LGVRAPGNFACSPDCCFSTNRMKELDARSSKREAASWGGALASTPSSACVQSVGVCAHSKGPSGTHTNNLEVNYSFKIQTKYVTTGNDI
jgi:hypothetical protein